MELWEFLTAFLAMFFTDMCYTYYFKAVQHESAIPAGLWAALLYILTSIVVIGYIHNPWLLIPSMLGAFFGTYFGVKYKFQ
jgi:hypothetical protein